MPNRWTLAIIAALLWTLFDITAAHAWGPATHVHLGTQTLGMLGLLPASVAAILARHGLDYLYGNVAADVVFAKRWSRVKQFCHHWTTGFRILDNAHDESQQAFALGYLSHLAADTIAHGKFVPRQLAVTRTSMSFGHLYWEMRADTAIGPQAVRQLEVLAACDFRAHDDILASVMDQTFLPHDMNLQLFRGINRLVTRTQWRQSVDRWGRHSRWPLCNTLLDHYHRECVDRIRSVLAEQRQSPVLHDDPNGTSALLQARVNRRTMRRLRRRGLSAGHLVEEAAASFAPNREPTQIQWPA